MKRLLFCFVVLFSINEVAFSQLDSIPVTHTRNGVPHSFYIIIDEGDRASIPIIHGWLGTNSRILTHDMRLTYRTPEGFEEGGSGECFENDPILRTIFSCLTGRLQSKENEFVSFLQIFPISTDFVDKQHQNQMRAIYNVFHKYFQYIQGQVEHWRWWGNSDSFQLDWRESAYFFSQEEARSKFNADTAAFFTLTLPPKYYYLGKYRYIDVFLLQKMGRGYVYFVSFYTEKAKRNINWYRRRLWGSLRYED